jgi:hypothetical protein
LYSKKRRTKLASLGQLFMGSVLACAVVINAHAEIAVVVNVSVFSDGLTLDDIANLFLKRVKDLPSSIELTPIDQRDAQNLKQEFYLKVTGKNPNQLNAYWARLMFTGKGVPPQTVRNDDEVLNAVRSNLNFVGYIDASKVDNTVKVLFSM